MLDQHLVNVSSTTRQVTNLVTAPLGKRYTWLRGKKRKRTKFVVSQMEMKKMKGTMRKMTMGETMW